MTGASLPEASDSSAEPAAQLRRSAAWMLAAFAAVGSVLFAGLTLTSLKDIPGGWMWAALVGFIVAITGVFYAITNAARILAPVIYTTTEAIADTKDRRFNLPNPALFGTLNTPSGAFARLRALQGRISRESAPTARAALLTEEANVQRAIGRWMDFRALQKLQAAADDVKIRIRDGAILTTVGALLFAFAAAQDTVPEQVTALRALAEREAKVTAREAKANARDATYARRLATYTNADRERAARLTDREIAVLKREQAVALKETAPVERLTFPARGTWVQATTLGRCPPNRAIPVTVMGVESSPVINPQTNKAVTAPVARIITHGTCSGQVASVSAFDGRLTIPQGIWELQTE